MSAFVQLLSCRGSLITQTALGTETLQNIEDIFRLKGKNDCAARAARLVLHYLPHGNKIDKMKVLTAMSVRVAKSLFVVKG